MFHALEFLIFNFLVITSSENNYFNVKDHIFDFVSLIIRNKKKKWTNELNCGKASYFLECSENDSYRRSGDYYDNVSDNINKNNLP